MKKKGEFREPETFRWWLHENTNGVLIGMYFDAESKAVPVRMLRERDYKTLIRLAKKAAKRGK